MGSGCSTPLRRLGGKKAKTPTHRSPSVFESLNDDNKMPSKNIQDNPTQQAQTSHGHTFIVDNEPAPQSEANDEHPSTASCNTDGRLNPEESTQVSEHSSQSRQHQTSTSSTPANRSTIVARMMASTVPYAPYHDRHLLVSPALSPAPSICCSPSPAGSAPVSVMVTYDLNDLDDTFKFLTLGLPDASLIKQPERIQSDLQRTYTQQLVQNPRNFINSLTVIFTTSDDLQSNNLNQQDQQQFISIETIANLVESNLKTFCDEHLFNLKFLNLSQVHLSRCFHTNNLNDIATKILEQELEENRHRIVSIVLTNNYSHQGGKDSEVISITAPYISQNSLPTKISSEIFTRLITLISEDRHLDVNSSVIGLMKQWYYQVDDQYHLHPIYSIKAKISSELKDERDQAWQEWQNDAAAIFEAIALATSSDQSLIKDLNLKSIFGTCIDFIMNDSSLQKKTLLIRNYSQPIYVNNSKNQRSCITIPDNDGLVNELAHLLADPSKLNIKRSMPNSEFIKSINDWINENMVKFLESFQENRITYGQYVPPFIEKNLLIELSCHRCKLQDVLRKTVDTFETKCSNFYSSQLQPIISPIFDRINSSTSHLTEPDGGIKSNQTNNSSNHLVFISGPRGCGKSTLIAHMIKHIVQSYLTKIQIIYRFCGLTIDSSGSDRLLRSICEQFCQMQGENTTAACQIYTNRKEVMSAINKVMRSQSFLIFLDGVDIFHGPSDLDWLFEIEAASNTKIFITLETDSAIYRRALELYSEATFINMQEPSIKECCQVVETISKLRKLSVHRTISQSLKDANQTDNKGPNFTFSDMSDIISLCQIKRMNNHLESTALSASLASMGISCLHQLVITHLHYLVSPYQLCALFLVYRSSRYGMVDTDVINIMAAISANSSGSSNSHCFSCPILNYIKIQLKPWLRDYICEKVVKSKIEERFSSRVITYYTESMYPELPSEVRNILLEYFGKPQKTSLVSLVKPDTNTSCEPKDRVSPCEAQWIATQASEALNLLLENNPSKARDHILNKYQIYTQFLYSNDPESFVEDFARLKNVTSRKSSSSNADDLQILVDYIRQSIYPLRYSGSQIYSQMYCRAYELIKNGKQSRSKKMNEILSQACSPPIRSLMPLSEASINSFIKTRLGQVQDPSISKVSPHNLSYDGGQRQNYGSVHSNSQQIPGQPQLKQKIFNIKDNHRHVIIIYPEKNSLCVWDIYEEKAVRTINNMDTPRDLRMIDQKRAVILCNRELRVYDLDSGLVLTKLKGVMNQKMPFFEVFGENYVVALARNRMYVNMMNLNTGELETTFKVGEDRFLNSLLVSADGGICVCGDETQKPFPLLVWNLNERRLMYDLRLDRHEFITRLSAISDDGHFVVSVCRQLGDGEALPHGNTNSSCSSSGVNSSASGPSQRSSPNFIVIYDLNSGTLFKKWKPGLDSCSVAISISSNRSGKVINTISDSSILVWDLATGSKRHTLLGHNAPADVVQVQNNTLFSMDSTCRDQSLRIWDIEEGYCLAVFSPDAPVTCCQMSIRGDALVCGFTSEIRLSTLALCKNETVADVVKRNKRRKSSRSVYIFDEPSSRKPSS